MSGTQQSFYCHCSGVPRQSGPTGSSAAGVNERMQHLQARGRPQGIAACRLPVCLTTFHVQLYDDKLSM